METTNIVVLLCIFASAIAGPITLQESDKCATECSTQSNFKYNPGTTYVYDYRVDTDSSIAGAFEDSAKTTIQTSVHIEVLSPCEFALQLKDTRLFHSDGKGSLKTADRENEFRSEVEGSPLKFSFQSGIVDHVCSQKEESVRSLNFKKGILSAFQNTMDDLIHSQNVTETDVAGVCKAEYKVVSNGYYTTDIKKVKNILSCSDRMDFMTMVQSTAYKVPSDLQNLPIMKTSHECDQSIENGGILKSSICKENHIYRPFANGESGSRTMVTQTLTYQTYRSGVSMKAGDITSRFSLIFDHSADHPTKEQSRSVVEKTLIEICDTTHVDIRSDTPRLFSELVIAMKQLNKQDMADIHQMLKSKTMCSSNGRTYKYFHDALPMVSTSASVSLMTDLIKSKDVSGLEATAWLTSLAFVQNPTSAMLLDIKTLIDDKDVRMGALLPVSSMVNNFCKKMGTCDQDQAVLSLISSFERNIDDNCDASGKNFKLTLLTLKAIGNAGHAVRAIPVVNKCLTSTSNPIEIRVAAAKAFRRMPCTTEDKNIWDTFTNKELDSELRINAYLALMRCPTEANLAKMAAILNDEEDEQVGGFVYSHLTNLRETSDPHKQGVAEAINNLALDKEFDLNPLKNSRNFEVSALINKINTGITAEGNLIWSNKAQLPRSVSGNLTVELFGQSINLLDFGGRLEGLEYLIKNIFGPYMNSNEKEKFDAENVKGSIYGRVFGNELLFLHSQDSKSLFGDKSPSWLDLVIKMAKEQHLALTQSVQFIDMCMVIPSSAGLPIHLRVNGTATIDLNMSGKMDLRKAGASPRSMDVDGEIRPSAAVEITGTMFVDSFVTKTGLRMRNTLHTSTAMKGRIQMNRGQQLNVELDTPEDKMEVFDARSKFFILHNDMEQEQKMVKENRKEFKLCSSKQMTQITGMEMCGELSFPNASMKADSPYFPMTGPTAVSITLFKRDSHSGYKLFAKRVDNKKASIAQISINTPGSKIDRAISVDMSLNYKKQNVDLNMATPWKKVALNGNLINLKNLKSLSGNLVIDDKDTYAMTGEVKVTQSKSKVQVNPMIEFRRPRAESVQLTGFISMEKPLKSVNMEMSLSGIQKLPLTLKTALKNNKKERSIDASLSLDGKKEYSFKASNIMSIMSKKSVMAVIKNLLEVQSPERKLMTLSNSVDYREGRSLKLDTNVYLYRVLRKPAVLKVNLQKTSRKKATNYKGVMTLKSSRVSGTIVCNLAKKPKGLMSLTSKVDYTIPKVSKNTVTFSGKLNDRSTKAYKAYVVQSIVGVKQNPEYNSNIKIDIGHKKKLTYAGVDIKYGANPKDKTKRIYFLTSLNRKITSLKNAVVNYKLKAQAPVHDIDILLAGKHQHTPKMLDSSVQLTYAPKKEINAGISLRDRSTKVAKINGKAALSWPGTEYSLSTDLTQKSAKQYNHVLNLKSSSGTKHMISTVYKMPKTGSHDVAFNLRLHNMKPVSISGATSWNRNNYAASGEFKTGKDVYGFNALTKISNAPSAKFNLELIHPERRITLDVNGGKSRTKYEGKVEAAWDADKNKDSKISLEGGYFHKSAKGSISLGGNAKFQSPFEHFENILGNFKYGSDPSGHKGNGKFMWGGKSQITSTMTVKKPISLKNLQLSGDIKTPFKGIRNAQIDINHKLESGLSTMIKGSLEKENAKLLIQGKSIRNGYKGTMNLKSTIKNAESLITTVSHTSNDGSYTSSAQVNHNSNVYAYELNMAHSGDGWQRKTNGDLILTLKKLKISTQWNHENTDESVQSTLSSKWNNKQMLLDLNGSHKLSDLRHINGVLKIKSPWKPIDDIEINIDHKHGTSLINSIAFLRHGSDKKVSSTINYIKGQSNADFDFEIVSPFREPVSGKLSTNYENYPMTSSAELKWAPGMEGTVEGSLNLASWNNADLNVKMTTPSTTLRNVVLKASHKQQDGELLSHLNLDYGMRQNIDIESRIANEDQKKMIRLKVKSPFEHVKSLDTGLNFNGHLHNFDTTVDFELLPNIGKFDGVMNWQYDNELNGKIRVDTPLPEHPFFELSTSSVRDGKLRKSQIQAKHYPNQAYILDTTYNFELPLSFDTMIPLSFDAKIKSPFPEYNDIGLSFEHELKDSSIKSRGEVRYQSDKKIEGVLNADWASSIEGDLLVKTPFRGYETSKIAMRHRGKLHNFESHGEISVAEQSIVTDASFKSGYTTTGSFTFSSPIPGLEHVDASIKKKGNLKNIKGSAIINVNDNKMQAMFNNKFMKDSLKTSFSLMTPYTESFKFALEHSGLPESFDNKVNINYGRKVDIDTVASFDLRENDVNGKGILKFKLGNGRNTARVSFSKSGTIEDVSFSTTTGFNKDEISINGALKTNDGIDGSLQIKTPFDDFKNTGITLSHSGDMTGFTTTTNINYMDNKHINGKLDFSNVARNGIKLTSELTTPFKNFESTSVKLNHEINSYSNDISGTAELTTNIGKFGTGEISYSKSGDLNDLVLKGSLSSNGKHLAVLKLTNNMHNAEVHSMCSLKSAATPDIYVSVDHTGDSFSFNTKAVAKVGKNMMSTDANMKRSYDSISADSSVTYRLQGQRKNKASISLFKEGPLENCNFKLTGKFNDDEAELSASKSGSVNNMHFSGSASYNKDSIDVNGGWKNTENIEGTLKVLTPFDDFKNLGIVFSHTGDLSDFTTNLDMNYMDSKKINGKVELTDTRENIKFVFELMTPFENFESLHIKANNKFDSYTSDLTGSAAIDTSIAGFGTGSIAYSMPGDLTNLEVTGKFNDDEAKLSASKSGSVNNMHFSGSASYNKDSIDVNGGWKNTENIEGTLKVLTPFDDFKNLGIVFSHTGDLSDFTTNLDMNYMDSKKINGKVELTDTRENIKFVFELMTPFENFESLHIKANNKFDSYTSDLTGNAAIDTSIAGFGTGSIVYSKSGDLTNLEVTGNALRNGVEIADLKMKNTLQDQELHSSFEYKSTVTPHLRLTLDHNGDWTNLKTSAKAVLGTKNIIKGEASLNQRENIIDAEGKVMYTIEDYGSNQASLNIHKDGQLNNFNVELTGKHGGEMSKITGNFKNEDELVGVLTVNIPIEGYKNVGLSFKHSGTIDRFNCEGKVTLADGEEYSGKIDHYRYLLQRIETVVELNTPIPDYEFTKFDYRHEGESDSFKCISTLEYGKSQRITYDLTATSSPKPQLTVTLKMPKNELMASGSYENTWPRYAVNCKLDAGSGNVITLDGSIDVSKDIIGVLTLSTPIEGFHNVGLNFQHLPDSNSINTEGQITYMDGKVISGKVDAKISKNVHQASVELTTPFTGYEFTKYETKLVFNKRIGKITKTLILGTKKFTMDAYSKFNPSPEFSVTISSPNYQDIEVFVSLDNSWPKYELTCRLSPGNGDQFTMDGIFDATNDISGSLKIGTPFDDFNKIGMNFIHSGNAEKFGTEGKLTYMDDKEIFGKVIFYKYMWRRIDASFELNTPFTGMETTKAEVNFEDNSNSISTTAALEYNNGKKLNGNVKMTYSPNYEVLLTLNTPFNEYNVIRAQGALDLTEPTYEAICSLNYGDNKVYSANTKLNLYSAEHLDGSLEVNTPLSGFEVTKVEYQHKADSSGLDGSVSLTYDDGKKMSCDVKSTLTPNFDGTVTVMTPFRGFEKMQATATFESSYKKYETSSSLNFGQGSIFSMSSDLDYSLEPVKASTKISTPFKDFRNVQLDITHEGGLTNFKTTGFFSSPLTDHVNAKASLRYDGIMDMSAAASLQSSLEGFDDLKAEFKTSDLAGEKKSSAVIGWTSSQQIIYEGLFRKQDGWNKDKMHAGVSISTPFVAVHDVNIQMDHSAETNRYVEKLTFELNGDTLLDADTEYNFDGKQSAELTVRQPWPMQYTASKTSYDGNTDAEVLVNWNRDELNSNVLVQASVADKSDSYQTENGIDLSITYASRKVGVVHKLSNKASQLMSNGHVYWNTDDESKVSYDLQVNDNSRRRKQILDGSFKFGLPTRTLGLTGSYSKNAAIISTDAVFNWDADRDDTKQVGVKTTIKRGDSLKGDIAVDMPSLRKKIQIDGEIMLNNGRVILDTKTDISYSRDSRKTLTLTSKLEDISNRNSHFNYSLALGVKHPHTNVDIMMNSHIGSSDERLTFGINTNYLTNKRQMKNLALLSEINLLKKQMSMQLSNPMNKIEIIGDVVSENPHKLRFLNRIDDVETFRCDMTVNKDKKAFSINAFTDSDVLSFSAKYPNSSAFRIDFTRHTPDYDQEEALLAVRLNTTRLLHTRLSWHPEMMQEFIDYAVPRALEKTGTTITTLRSINEDVAEEISGKYVAITNEMTQELRPFIRALNEELALVAEKMNELSVELKEMYERNDYYIQNLGEGVLELQQKMKKLTDEYKNTYAELINTLRVNLREMRRFPIGEHYTEFVTSGAKWLVKESVKSIASLSMYMAEVDLALKEYKASMQEMKQRAWETIYNGTYVDYLANKMNQAQNIDVSPYISSFHLPEQYTNVIYQVPSKINAKLNDILNGSRVQFVKEGLNEVYQQGVWAYNYWQIEENLEKHAQSILKTLKEIVKDELKEYSEDFDFDMLNSPITVWDPEHGEIQADIPLPIDVKRLDELPDITPLINNAEKFAVTYLPDQGTWDSLVKSVSDLWPAVSNETDNSDLTEELSFIKPSRKLRKYRSKRPINKSSRQ